MHPLSTPVTMWFDPRLVFRKSSIQGIGTFAAADIRAGEPLMFVRGGIAYTSADFQTGAISLEAELYNEAPLGDGVFVATPKVYHYYINHSCEPNVVNIAPPPYSYFHYTALRDIKAGEELTADYYTKEMLAQCDCGSAQCRWK